jgi:tetratricopeptide (TPR) repeat protein
MEKMGKLDDAIGLLDSLAKKNPDSNAIGSAAGLVARAIDRRAQELEKAGKLKERDAELKRAAVYYAMSGHALAKSKSSRASTIEEIANRLFVLGLQFNEVPKEWDSFVGWPAAKTTDPTLFKEAENLYRAALQISPSYQNQIKLGRSLGFQGQYAEASSVYGRLFDSESIIDPASNPPKFNAGLLKEKPELYVAYLEWGVANEEAGLKAKDNESYLRAEQIFDNLVRTPDPEGPRRACILARQAQPDAEPLQPGQVSRRADAPPRHRAHELRPAGKPAGLPGRLLQDQEGPPGQVVHDPTAADAFPRAPPSPSPRSSRSSFRSRRARAGEGHDHSRTGRPTRASSERGVLGDHFNPAKGAARTVEWKDGRAERDHLRGLRRVPEREGRLRRRASSRTPRRPSRSCSATRSCARS